MNENTFIRALDSLEMEQKGFRFPCDHPGRAWRTDSFAGQLRKSFGGAVYTKIRTCHCFCRIKDGNLIVSAGDSLQQIIYKLEEQLHQLGMNQAKGGN